MKTSGYFLVKKGNAQQAFQLSEFTLNDPQQDEVMIEVEAFGLNYADVMARNGLYREAPSIPCVLGYEVVGTVVAVGATSESQWIGKRVVAFTRFGGYAKHVVTKIDALAEIGTMNTNHALALATQGVTAYYMSNYTTIIRPTDKVLIHAAAGGVGTLLIQLAKLAGATVVAKVSSNEKQEMCLKYGADFTVNYTKHNYVEQVEQLIGKKQLDVSYNPVGGDTFKKDQALVGFGGRIVLFGGSQLSEGKLGILSQLNFLRKMGVVIPAFQMMQSKSVIGVNMLKVSDAKPKVLQHCLQAVVKLYQEHKLKIETGGEFSSNDLAIAHELLESGKSMGKISVQWTVVN